MHYNPTSLGAAVLVAMAIGRSLNVKVVVSSTARTAYIRQDEKTGQHIIVIPELPVKLDAQLSAMLWGLIHHEAGHCRHTELDVYGEPDVRNDRTLQHLLQALEDIRMERAHIGLYPGAHRVLRDLVEVLVDNGFFKPLSPESDVSTAFHAYVLKHLRANVLGQTALAEQAHQARDFLEKAVSPGFVTRLTAELQSILSATSTTESLNVAYRVRDLLKDELEREQSPPPPSDGEQTESTDESATDASALPDPSPADPDEEQRSDDAPPSDGSGESPEDLSNNDEDASNADSSEADDDEDNSDSSCNDKGDESTNDDEKPDPAEALHAILNGSDLDDSLGDLGQGLADVISDGIEQQSGRPVTLPTDHKASVGYRDASAVHNARSVSAKLAVQLKRQLESINLVTSEPAIRGKRVSRRHLHRVAFKDYRVFTDREYQPEINTAVVSLIDVSSSMRSPKIELASQAILATSLALGTIPFLSHCVGAFPSQQGADRVELVQAFNEKAEPVSSRFALSARGNTPLAEALLWAANRLIVREEERRIIFVATDGQPNDVETTRQILTELRPCQIEIHGLGIDTDDPHDLFDSFVTIENIETLPKAFLELFQRVLRRSA